MLYAKDAPSSGGSFFLSPAVSPSSPASSLEAVLPEPGGSLSLVQTGLEEDGSSVAANPTLSLIIPLYGVAPYLDALFTSLSEQTDRHFEVLLVDDGSTDGSRERAEAEICIQEQRRLQGDPAIYRLLLQPNQGVGVARNHGLDEAKGDWIWWIDGDDRIEGDAVARLREASAQHPKRDWLLFDFRTESTDGKPLSEYLLNLTGCGEDSQPLLLTPAAPWNKIYRRSFLLKNGLRFPETLRYEDLGFFLNNLAVKPRWAYLPHSLYRYRLRPASAMHIGISPRHCDLLRILEESHRCWVKHGLIPSNQTEWESVSAYHGYLSALTRLLRAGAKRSDLEPYQKFRKQYCPQYRHSLLLTRKQRLLGLLYDLRLYNLARKLIGPEPM